MRTMFRVAIAVAVLLACCSWFTPAEPKRHTVDVRKSSIVVHVYKAGFFSAFGHNHEIEAPIGSGEVIDEAGRSSVDLHVDARRLRVLDPEVSSDTLAQIQKTMLGAQVLDADRYSDIRFRSATVEAKGAGRWLVNGIFDLHGQEHPLETEVTLKDGLYEGSFALKQTDFGITPVAVAGGTVKVRDEVRIEFRIALSD